MSSEYHLLHWELIYRLIEKSLSRKEDILVSVVHTILINSGFKCIGLGNSSQPDGRESENLPEKWNEGPEYSIRYIKNGKVYVLNTLHVDGEIIVSLLSRDDNKVRSVAFNISSTVVELRGDSLSALIPDIRNVVTKIESELMESEKSVQSQTDPPWQSSRATTSSPPPFSRVPQPMPTHSFGPERFAPPIDPFDYGRSDLNPFGGGGGMIFDPLGGGAGRRPRIPGMPGAGVPGGLPRGAVPPGARFEPFGPSNPDGRRGPNAPQPDPDHMPPPGYDDMFM
ncbi:proteasome inhibitor PI31 subunit [Nilaparvata lugens]|uniref:proteasome inhibitor PI31 subunit n=1 Tax=Nilaparvata lugens TaxID=108931 RepID=UPI00193C9ED8|nr:proteasome inhibitor PI31 subunit [Nilaparvata lugens]